MLNPRADPERFIRVCVCVGGGSPIPRFSVIVEGVPLKSFPDFHGINNWSPEGVHYLSHGRLGNKNFPVGP